MIYLVPTVGYFAYIYTCSVALDVCDEKKAVNALKLGCLEVIGWWWNGKVERSSLQEIQQHPYMYEDAWQWHAHGHVPRTRSVAVQHLLAQDCLLRVLASQQIGFGLRFTETKLSIIMWLQSYMSRILITTLNHVDIPIFKGYLSRGPQIKSLDL